MQHLIRGRNNIPFHILFSFSLFLLTINKSFSQDQLYSGSILGIVSSDKKDTDKVDALLAACKIKYKYAQYTEAKKYADAALMLAEKANYNDGIAEANNQIGVVYWYIKEYDSALGYHLKALAAYELSGNKKGISGVYNRIGHAYADMHDYPQALEYFQKALSMDELVNDQTGIAKNLNLIGFVHMRLSDYDKALGYYFKSLSLSEKISNNRGIAAAYHDVGEVYEKQNKPDQALLYASKGLALALEVGEKKLIEEAYDGLEKIYIRKKDYRSAYNTRITNDKLLAVEMSEDHAGKIKQMQMEYEFEKKQEQDRIVLDKEKEIEEIKLSEQKTLTYISFSCIVIAILFSLFIFKSYKEQRSINKKLKETQEQLIKSEKMAAYGSMASRLSHELLNPMNFINNFSQAVNELSDEIVSTTDKKHKDDIAKLIKESVLKINEHGKRATDIIHKLEDHGDKGTAHEFFEEK